MNLRRHGVRNRDFDTMLPWGQLRDACRRFVADGQLLRSLKVHFRTNEGEDIATDCVRRQLAEFEDVSERGQATPFFWCEQEGCRWRGRK